MKCVIFFVTVVALGTYSMELDPDFELELAHNMEEDSANFLCKYMAAEDCEAMMNATRPQDTDDEKVVVSQGPAEIAIFDACNPREMTIALPRHPDPSITVWPTCTRAMRCGGCCTSDVFSCEPTATEERFMRVFDTKLPYPGAHRFTFLGVRVVTVIEHTQCDAQCKTKPHECHKFQVYEARKCRCVCRPERMRLVGTCSGQQIWDESECDCICPNRNTASCPEPSYFSTTTCRCTLKTGVTGEIDLEKVMKGLMGRSDIILKNNDDTDSDIDMIAGTGGMTDLGDLGVGPIDDAADVDDKDDTDEDWTTTEPTTTSTTSTTTTTTASTTTPTTTTATTTTPKPTEKPCAGKTCPGVWKLVLLSNGNCQCVPPSFGGSRG
ncbi:uncharacterized protein LOC128228708 [Mya arenaria]|uniref:uncharacterized protein LOC128228708 n=1 Tax=Mya arenaria TaxID=6604 RepID=UPI0022E7004E|nr:uncharacterized protein LOC128228708 [Mya arenaria]